jgi:hypothetical protein
LVDGNLVAHGLTGSPQWYGITFASAGNSTIEFLSSGQGWVNHVNYISVNAVPEPSNFAALAGLGLVGGLIRRKRS